MMRPQVRSGGSSTTGNDRNIHPTNNTNGGGGGGSQHQPQQQPSSSSIGGRMAALRQSIGSASGAGAAPYSGHDAGTHHHSLSRRDGRDGSRSVTPSASALAVPASSGALGVMALHEERLSRLVETLGALQEAVAMETNGRLQASKALLETFDQQLDAAAKGLETKYRERVVAMTASVARLGDRVKALEEELAVERDKNARLTEELLSRSDDDVEQVRRRLEQERAEREGAVAGLVAQVSKDLDRLHERLDAEHLARDAACRDLRQAFADTAAARGRSDERLLAQVRHEMEQLAVAIDDERRERQAGEESIASTLEFLAGGE